MSTPNLTNAELPAFPYIVNDDFQEGYRGLTKREWFAGQALAGLIGRPPEVIAEMAVEIADAVLAELAKEKK